MDDERLLLDKIIETLREQSKAILNWKPNLEGKPKLLPDPFDIGKSNLDNQEWPDRLILLLSPRAPKKGDYLYREWHAARNLWVEARDCLNGNLAAWSVTRRDFSLALEQFERICP